jgi:hypothetical protein
VLSPLGLVAYQRSVVFHQTGAADGVALDLLIILRCQRRPLFLGRDSFGRDREMRLPPETITARGRLWIAMEVENERLIDLDLLEQG